MSHKCREETEDVRALFKHAIALGVGMPISGVNRLIQEHGLDEATERVERMAETPMDLRAREFPTPEGEQRA